MGSKHGVIEAAELEGCIPKLKFARRGLSAASESQLDLELVQYRHECERAIEAQASKEAEQESRRLAVPCTTCLELYRLLLIPGACVVSLQPFLDYDRASARDTDS